MAGNGYVGTAIRREDAVKSPLRPDILVGIGLAVESYPKLVVLSETGLDPIAWEEVVDECPVAAPIARVSTDAFAEVLLDLWHERVSGRHIKAIESVVCRLETSSQGTCVVALRRGNLLILNL